MKNYIESGELSKQLDVLIVEQANTLRKSLQSRKVASISGNYV